ncbi:hypothetical protein KQX54_005162 [Cotesia glomerata]|uniref:Uncharacterized protein n=1 Tax=Cotesia glomerata TaxID=32391 RepID=A0AAV7I2G4_COTGL|nr:hypothetical protein KQX54_005162 [Cotesia glomerata]
MRVNENEKATSWYRVDKTKIQEDILKLWMPLGVGERKDQPDKSAEDFLARSANKSDSLLLQVWHSLATSALSWFINRTSINGLVLKTLKTLKTEQDKNINRLKEHDKESRNKSLVSGWTEQAVKPDIKYLVASFCSGLSIED